jgi:hypothetical protein
MIITSINRTNVKKNSVNTRESVEKWYTNYSIAQNYKMCWHIYIYCVLLFFIFPPNYNMPWITKENIIIDMKDKEIFFSKKVCLVEWYTTFLYEKRLDIFNLLQDNFWNKIIITSEQCKGLYSALVIEKDWVSLRGFALIDKRNSLLKIITHVTLHGEEVAVRGVSDDRKSVRLEDEYQYLLDKNDSNKIMTKILHGKLLAVKQISYDRKSVQLEDHYRYLLDENDSNKVKSFIFNGQEIGVKEISYDKKNVKIKDYRYLLDKKNWDIVKSFTLNGEEVLVRGIMGDKKSVQLEDNYRYLLDENDSSKIMIKNLNGQSFAVMKISDDRKSVQLEDNYRYLLDENDSTKVRPLIFNWEPVEFKENLDGEKSVNFKNDANRYVFDESDPSRIIRLVTLDGKPILVDRISDDKKHVSSSKPNCWYMLDESDPSKVMMYRWLPVLHKDEFVMILLSKNWQQFHIELKQ